MKTPLKPSRFAMGDRVDGFSMKRRCDEKLRGRERTRVGRESIGPRPGMRVCIETRCMQGSR